MLDIARAASVDGAVHRDASSRARFVSDTPPAALVDRAAATFTRTDGDIREVVRTIVTSPGVLLARGVSRQGEVAVRAGGERAARARTRAPDTTPRTAQLVAQLGQPIFGHQAPNGWPETGDAWMNTGAILNRINFGLALAAGRRAGRAARARGRRRSDAARRDARAAGGRRDRARSSAARCRRTRAQILITGENPSSSRAPLAADATDARRCDDVGATTVRSATRTTRGRRDDGGALAAAGSAAGQGSRRRSAASSPGLGLAQVVGLALGAPEFQRR